MWYASTILNSEFGPAESRSEILRHSDNTSCLNSKHVANVEMEFSFLAPSLASSLPSLLPCFDTPSFEPSIYALSKPPHLTRSLWLLKSLTASERRTDGRTDGRAGRRRRTRRHLASNFKGLLRQHNPIPTLHLLLPPSRPRPAEFDPPLSLSLLRSSRAKFPQILEMRRMTRAIDETESGTRLK